LKNTTILFFTFLTCVTSYCQTISERLIITDTKDSVYLHSDKTSFDRNGNYCFTIIENGDEYFITPNDKIGGYKFIGSTYGIGGEINYTNSYSDPADKPFYYKNGKGTKVYGTAIGKIEGYQTSNTRENIAIVTTLKDSVFYYINGKKVLSSIKDSKKHYITEDDWVSFSENGNTIYFIKRDDLYFLYVNDRLIESSKFEYTQLAINDSGTYVFAKGKRPEQKIDTYDYMFFIHSMDSVLGHVRTVWDYELKENGAYYYSGEDNGPYYIAINDKLYKNINNISNITLLDKNTFMYTYAEEGTTKINVSDKIYTHDFEKIFHPSLDTKGNFAFYGLKDYYLFKYINGKKEDKPISDYSVRATPLYISPKGESIHYFKTDDLIYIYQDDKLLFKPISKKNSFQVLSHKEILPNNFVRGKSENGNSLFYIEFDSTGYLVFNGVFSKPTIPVKARSYSEAGSIGEIVAGEYNDHGFFAIQKIGSSKYLLNINNQIYKEIDTVDLIFEKDCFFNGKELIFYGVKGLSFYQFKLTL